MYMNLYTCYIGGDLVFEQQIFQPIPSKRYTHVQTVHVCIGGDLVFEQLDAMVDVTDDDEVLQRHGSVAVYVRVDEGHTHQVLVVLEVPHEYL